MAGLVTGWCVLDIGCGAGETCVVLLDAGADVTGVDGSGPFALAEKDRLRGILERAGFADIAIDPFDFPVRMAAAGGGE